MDIHEHKSTVIIRIQKNQDRKRHQGRNDFKSDTVSELRLNITAIKRFLVEVSFNILVLNNTDL